MRWAAFVVILACLSGVVGAQEQTGFQSVGGSSAAVTFEFEREGLSVPHFVLTLREDGSGIYQAEEVERRSADSALQQVSQHRVERMLTVSPATVDKIFRTARALNRFNIECSSKAKNIADMGKKVLSYSGADGSGSCTFHYSQDKNVAMLAETFLSIAYTMDIGRKLEFEHRFDRLGLDAEMISLQHSVEDKSALELGTISATLSAIAKDVDLMQRVRVLAAKLLEQVASKQ